MLSRFYLVFLVLVSFILYFSTFSWAENKRIVLVHSYDCDDACGGPQREGVLEAFNSSPLAGKVEFFDFYMDTKNKNVEHKSIIKVAKEAIEFIKKINPEIIICFDDNSFLYVGMNFLKDKNKSIVFTGLNGLPEDYNKIFNFMISKEKPGYNVTGVYEKLYTQKSINVFKHILPNLKTILVITDNTTTGKALSKQIFLETKDLTDIEIKNIVVENFEEYKKIILEINKRKQVDAIYPLALSLRQGKQIVGPNEILAWTIKNSRIPDIAVNYYFCQLGLLGGATVDFKEMGKQAGEKAIKILQGVAAGNIPIDDARAYALAFNIQRAKMLGLNIPKNILFAAHRIYKDIKVFEYEK
ncbi:MAG: hypothetical protein PWR24_58 [Desulfonauticus sp.]|nr:hypothetical protein [Desulfonauticus sp.]